MTDIDVDKTTPVKVTSETTFLWKCPKCGYENVRPAWPFDDPQSIVQCNDCGKIFSNLHIDEPGSTFEEEE